MRVWDLKTSLGQLEPRTLINKLYDQNPSSSFHKKDLILPSIISEIKYNFQILKNTVNHGVWSPFELHFGFSLKTSFGLFGPKTLNKPSVQNPSSDFHKKRSHFILSYNLNPKISNFKKYLKTWGLKPKGQFWATCFQNAYQVISAEPQLHFSQTRSHFFSNHELNPIK